VNPKEWYWEMQCEKLVDVLKSKKFNAEFVKTRTEAKDRLLELIPREATVGFGGSMTLSQVGIIDALSERGNVIITKRGNPSDPETVESRRKALHADVFLSSANALTRKGQLVNLDGMGNRVASMIFGPKNVFIVCGLNKIVNSLEEAFARIKMAAVINCRRLGTNTPCVHTGECSDCRSPERICNVYSIIERNPGQNQITVIIVGEELGF